MRGLTPVPRLAQETAESSRVPLVFQRLSNLGRPGHDIASAHRVTRGQAPKQAWKAGLALVTSQCHMQIKQRHGLPAWGNQ